ncbi:MAG: PAS domain S-box protein, partial [Flavobacteriales bacterium]|nr:PAS domain S-box protein [Flavobacteriales bacterium]
METLELHELLLDKLNTLIVVLNKQGEIEYVSNTAQRLLGYEPEDLLGDNWWKNTRASKPEGEIIKSRLMNVFNETAIKVHHFEHELLDAEGKNKWFAWNVSFLNESQLVGIGLDVTDKKEKDKILQEQHLSIQSSIRYAQRIQGRILQTDKFIQGIFKNSFVFYQAKDIVSGDFYFFHEDAIFKYVVMIDCTGHGVPGAIMSVLANSIVKEVLLNRKTTSPSAILNAMD